MSIMKLKNGSAKVDNEICYPLLPSNLCDKVLFANPLSVNSLVSFIGPALCNILQMIFGVFVYSLLKFIS